jgi:sulfur carrier protein ThiS
MSPKKTWITCSIGEMNVTVHLHTTLQRQTPDGLLSRLELNLPEGTTLADLLAELDIRMDPDALLLVVNSRMAGEGQVLHPGDQVNLMPALSGGAH